MTNAILLSPHFPPNFVHFAEALAAAGVKVMGIADAPFDCLSPALRSALAEYYRVDDMHAYDQLLRAVAFLTHRHGKIGCIESHNEYWLTTEAQLRTDFNVPGPKTSDMPAVKCKSRMKQVFQQAGIPVAPGLLAPNLETALAFAAEHGYPLIAKPDSGVGAAHTHRIDEPLTLRRLFADVPPVDYFLEVFVEGAIHSFDGLADAEGRVAFCASHIFSQGIMETVAGDADLYYSSVRSIPHDLEEAGRAAVAAFGLRARFFHIEFFRTPSGALVALELNMRPPGGLTMDMFNYAEDADLYRHWADIVAGNPGAPVYTRPYSVGYFGRKSHKRYRLERDALRSQLGSVLIHEEQLSPVFSQILGDRGYIVRSPDEHSVREAIDTGLAPG
jgi:biotin carboxylase